MRKTDDGTGPSGALCQTQQPGLDFSRPTSITAVQGVITVSAASNELRTRAGFISALEADREMGPLGLGCECPMTESISFEATAPSTEGVDHRNKPSPQERMAIDAVKEELTDIFCEVFPLLDRETLVEFVDTHPLLIPFQLNQDDLLEQLCLTLNGKLTPEAHKALLLRMRTNWSNYFFKHRPRRPNPRREKDHTVLSEGDLIGAG